MKYKVAIVLGCVLAVILLTVVYDGLVIKYNGVNVPTPKTPRVAERYGSAGASLTYVVMGDSTSVGQGGNYDLGFARATARYLGRMRRVTFYNVGISGARSADVVTKQLPAAVSLKPDFVLIAVGANDVTHLTSSSKVRTSLQTTIRALQAANPAVKIVLTGSPQMGSVARFPQPFKALEKLRTGTINKVIAQVAADNQVVVAPLAADTGAIFASHPELYAQDKFHPSTAGYSVWIPVLERAIDKAFQ